MLVIAHHGPAPIRGEMVQGVPISERQRRVGTLVWADAHPSAQDLVAVLVVDRVDAVAGEARHANRVAGAPAPSSEGRIDRVAAVGAAADGYAPVCRAATVAGEDLYHARHRVGPVQHAGRSSHYLDSLHVVGGQVGEVVRPARRVLRHAIDQDLHVVALPAAQKQ